MSERVPDPSTAHFGADGMRRFTVPASYGIQLLDATREVLTATGVPLHVRPYFTAAAESDAPVLGMWVLTPTAEAQASSSDTATTACIPNVPSAIHCCTEKHSPD